MVENKKTKGLLDGKQIILQRLRNSKNIKKFRFLETEIKDQVFDFYASRYSNYRTDSNNTLIFASTNKQKTIQMIKNENKPVWMSEQQFKHFVRINNNQNLFLEEIDDAISKYDAITNKHFHKLIHFDDKQRQYYQDKGQNTLFQVNYIISGKFEDGTEFRAPFELQEIEQILINNVTGKVTIVPGNKVYPNIPFISWAGNRFDIETESALRAVSAATIEENYIDDYLKVYAKLGIKIDKKYFECANSGELKLRRENKSIKNDTQTAIHEAKHLVCALHYGLEVDSIDINNNEDVLGKVFAYIDDETDSKTLITMLLAPYCNNKTFKYEDLSENIANTDFQYAIEELNKISTNIDEKKNVFNKCILEAQAILNKHSKKIDLFSEYLLKQRIMNSDDVIAQWENDTFIDSYSQDTSTIKFEKDKFIVEKVKLIALCPELAEVNIFKDVEYIFEETKFIENLLDSQHNKTTGNDVDESQISWGFSADISQQKAVFDTTLNDNTIIQGPPGTGKTQTILNIISNALADGKKVLVVAEKTTAVEVINDRFKEHAPKLANFIFDLYNIDKLGIKFYQELGKKLIYLNSKRFGNCKLSKNKNMQDKVDYIQKLSAKLEKLDIEELWKLSQKININKSDIELIENISTKDVSSLNDLTPIKIRDMHNWQKENNELKKFRDEYFKKNISDEIISNIFNFNKTHPYTSDNSYIYASLLLRNKPKVNIFIRRKYRKLAQENKLDEIFSNKYGVYEQYMNFDFNKYGIKDFTKLNDLEKIKEFGSTVKRVIEVNDYLNKKQDYIDLSEEIKDVNIYDYDDINKDINFANCQLHLYNKWQENAFEYSDDDRKAIADIIGCAQRQKMTKIVREIISKNWDYIYKAFPIVLTTPEALSNYIPCKKGLYDVVIIDEASQFLIERSIPALFRGKQRIISGDKMQLRPKIDNRFEIDNYKNDDDIKHKQLIEAESVLDLFELLFGQSGTMLTTHYRSEKHELIDFSNANFYDDKLNFIEKAESITKKAPIQVINVNGKWIDQTNQIEADEIINKLEEIYSKDKNASVGVIVFSKRQCNLIKKTLRYSKNKNVLDSFESNEPNSLFIKSIDEVQGEERDTIIFGITYGNNVHNYMLLSDTYARNKINVAITRAKKLVIIVKSHKASDYRRLNNDINTSGSSTLFSYLEYAENIASAKRTKSEEKAYSDIDNKMMEYLENKGIKIFKTISIRNKPFYLVKNLKSFDIYYCIDYECMQDARNKIWFFESLFKSRGYEPKPIFVSDLYNIK